MQRVLGSCFLTELPTSRPISCNRAWLQECDMLISLTSYKVRAREHVCHVRRQIRYTRAHTQPHTCIHTWTVWQLTRKSRQRPVAYLLGKWSDVSNDSKQGLEQRLTRTPRARAVGMMAEIGMLREQQLGDSMPVTRTRVR